MGKKKITADADEHNRKVLAIKKQEKTQQEEQRKQIAKYAKGLPSDQASLITQTRVMIQTGGQCLWEAGRRLIVLRSLCDHGQWGPMLEEIGISGTTAWRAMNAVKKIPESELKRLGRSHAYDMLGEPTKVDQEMIDKLESGELTEEDLIRESDVDIKKMLKEKVKLEAKLEQEKSKTKELQAEVDKLKLGTIDERAIERKIAEWQVQFDQFVVWIMSFKKSLPDKSQADLYSALQYFMHRLLVAEVHVADKFPKFDTYAGPDRGALVEWMQKRMRR